MGIKELMALGKGKAVAIAGGATVVAVGIAVAVAMQGKGFRSISVEQMAGTVNVTGEKIMVWHTWVSSYTAGIMCL